MCVIGKLKKKKSWNVWNYWKEFDNSEIWGDELIHK